MKKVIFALIGVSIGLIAAISLLKDTAMPSPIEGQAVTKDVAPALYVMNEQPFNPSASYCDTGELHACFDDCRRADSTQDEFHECRRRCRSLFCPD